jgi:hypothetical protein
VKQEGKLLLGVAFALFVACEAFVITKAIWEPSSLLTIGLIVVAILTARRVHRLLKLGVKRPPVYVVASASEDSRLFE